MKKAFYMVGRMGDQNVAIRAEKGKLTMHLDDPERPEGRQLEYDLNADPVKKNVIHMEIDENDKNDEAAGGSCGSPECTGGTEADRSDKGFDTTREAASAPIAPEALLPILRDILAGIIAIHQAGFAHRDIKPDNIIFVKGKPKIADIGLISSFSKTMTQIAGTLDFLPPESRTADGYNSTDRESRQRSDLYAFGKVIYCAATGQSPHLWPTVPSNTPLSAQLKFFVRLSFRLCDRERTKRLGSLPQLKREIAEIERKMTYGETLKDKLFYRVKVTMINIVGTLRRLICWGKRHWCIMLMVALMGGSLMLYGWPKQPFDITKQQRKEYTNPDLKLSMLIPFQWEVMSSATLQKMLNEIDATEKTPDALEKKRREFIISMLKFGADIIFCDYDPKLSDNIVIQTVPIPGDKFIKASDEELRHEVRELFQGQLEFNTEIYGIRRITIDGKPCIFIDLTHNPETMRINNYVVALEDKCFSIALTAKKTSFPERREQFESILKTVKIGK